MKLRATAVVVAAEASAQRLRASVTVANPVVQAQVAYATASTTAEIHAVSVTYVVPVSAISHINLAVGVSVDDSGRYPYIIDTAVILDSLLFSVGKVFSDVASVQELKSISTTKPFADGWTVADAVSVRPELFRSESVGVTDTDTYSMAKVLRETPVVTETLYFSMSKLRSDSWTVTDAKALQLGLTRFESVGTSDTDTYSLAKVLLETPVVTETLYFSVAKLLADSVGMSDSFDLNDGSTYTFTKDINDVSFVNDAMAKNLQPRVLETVSVDSSGSLRNQGYCDFTYFAEDYVGDSRTFT